MTMAGQLTGKVALITGAASGFGLATAKLLNAEGASVVAVDMNDEGLAESFSTVSSDRLVTLTANVTSLRDWQKMLEVTLSRFGALDILINNAGTSHRNKPTLEVTEDEFDKVVNVNIKSIYLSTQVIVQYMKEHGGGSVVNIASIGAKRPRPGLVWYNATKSAVVNATKGLAAEFGRYQIRVNAVCPLLSGTGLFETFVGVPYTEENMKKFLFNVPLGKLCEIEDVANACLYLSGPTASFVTGVTLNVDGGRTVGA